MLTLYHAPLTRSARIYWLLEELGVPYHLEQVTFIRPKRPFAQQTPFGKLPAIRDGDVEMFESGAILEYVLERYGQGRLAPAPGSPLRAPFLQWVHFSEATIMPPLGQIVWHTMFKPEEERIPAVVEDARAMVGASLDVVEGALDGKDYLLGAEFSGADIMMGYPLQSAKWFRVLTDAHPRVNAYFARLESRPAFKKAFASS